MASFLLLMVCLLLGMAVAHLAHPPSGLARSLNWWVLNIALPATVLAIIPTLQFSTSLWFLAASLWLSFICACLLNRIGNTLAPLALFSVGLQLQLKSIRHQTQTLLAGLSWKLGIAPLLVLSCGWLLHIEPPILTVTLLEAAMAPMISAAILAEQHNLNPPLANMMVGLGILLSFITVPLWNLLV